MTAGRPTGPAPARIPLTVIGGFLGAGKTTLLNRLLARWQDRRWAVLVNDFGAVNVDAALVRARDDTLISLSNGCVCCQIGDDLGDALMRVLALDPAPEHILIETSGISDPWRVAQVGLVDPALALDGVIVLVDAQAALDQDGDALLRDTVRRQLCAADLLVVNKCDRATPEEMEALRGWLDHVAPGTPRYEAVDADVPPEWLRDPGLDPAPAAPDRAAREHPGHGYVFAHWRFDTPHALSAECLRALLRAMPAGVLRLKGVVRTDHHPEAVLQFAGRHGSLRGVREARTGPRVSRVVAIGLRGQLPVDALSRAFSQAVRVDLGGLFAAPPET